MPTLLAGGEGERHFQVFNILAIDLIQGAESRGREILCGTDPLAIVRLKFAGVFPAIEVL